KRKKRRECLDSRNNKGDPAEFDVIRCRGNKAARPRLNFSLSFIFALYNDFSILLFDKMTRGNQRENDRAKALKKAGNSKNKTQMSGSEFARAKEDAAAIMREKQRKADEKRAAEAAAGGKKK
ncbi:hypothetical protein N7535_004462, partial [Penicillium sp. DV-2018c]